MQVKVKKQHPDAQLPKFGKPGDAGADLTCVSVTHTDDYIEYDTGLNFEIPEGYVGLLFPRSSNTKKDLLLGNSVGVLDSGFRGNVTFRYKYSGAKSGFSHGVKIYQVGDRIGQIIIMAIPAIEFVEATELSESERGSGGYGSTGA
jgi:dUTP pyrophosphatase